MKAVLVLGFKTPPAHRAAATEAARLLERITAVIFAPQPEPPKLARELFNVLDDMAHVPEFNPSAQGP
jgi:fructoselysine-6-P-deglycase FrlB-like protein